MTTDTPLLRLRGVTRSFGGAQAPVTVLRDVDLDIARGEMVAIMGPSGSGKSTLMNVLGCLDRASAGAYEVDGRDVATLDDDALAALRRDRFGFIFQRYHLMAHLDARANVEVPAIYAGMARRERHARAGQLLTRLGLGAHLSHRPAQMSGGQQQRVSIARALMNGGDIVLADEPTGALDSHSGLEVMQTLRELNARGHTVILVTHDPKVAAWAHRVIEIADGRIVADRAQTARDERTSPPESLANTTAGATGDGTSSKPATAPAQTATARPLDVAPSATTSLEAHHNAPADDRPAPPAPARLRRALAGWPQLTEALSMAWHALVSHRLRTGLTMLGIVIGIASVVSLSALGEGTKGLVLNDIRSIAPNNIYVGRGKDFNDDKAASIRTLVLRDAQWLAAQPYVDSVSPEIGHETLRVRYGNADTNAQVQGVGAHVLHVSGMQLAVGRGFDPQEVSGHAQVALLGEATWKKLMPDGADPVGAIVLVGTLPVRVVGVVRDRSSMFVPRALNVWVPWTTAGSRLTGQHHLDGINVRIVDGHPTAAAEAAIGRGLTQAHGRKDFFTFNMDSIVKSIERISQMLTLMLSLVALVSLVVGGIGVMNIMLVSVTERTREIGIRRAIGARRQDILRQFLIEAVLVCLMGGAVGAALSWVLGLLVPMFVPQVAMMFSPATFASAVVCATVIGIASGWLPARSAARLDPVEALARE